MVVTARRILVPLVGLVVGLGCAALIYRYLNQFGNNLASAQNLTEIGMIESLSGQVERRLPKSIAMETVPSPRPFYSQDLIVTHDNGQVVLTFKNGAPSLRVNPSSRFVAEIDATKPERINATLLAGTAVVSKPGDATKIRVFRDGQEISLQDAEAIHVPVLNSNTAPEPSVGEITVTATLPDETATPSPQVPVAPNELPQTGALSNADILNQLKTQMSFFQRCYLTFIDRSRQANASLEPKTGNVITSFEIESSGKIRSTKLVRSDFDDATLHSCLLEVIGRTRFRAFDGKAIPVQEFPIQLK